jgi:hypothetical protein
MADFVTGLIGVVLMLAYILFIAVKLNELALWLVCLVGFALMLWAFWTDACAPLLGRAPREDGQA